MIFSLKVELVTCRIVMSCAVPIRALVYQSLFNYVYIWVNSWECLQIRNCLIFAFSWEMLLKKHYVSWQNPFKDFISFSLLENDPLGLYRWSYQWINKFMGGSRVVGGGLDPLKNHKWASVWDFQQCGVLTCIDSDEPLQPPSKLRHSKWCSVRSLTVIEYLSD